MRDDYFDNNIGVNHPSTKNPTRWVSIPTLIISIIATAILVLLIVAKWDNILSMFGVGETEVEWDVDQHFRVGDEVSLTWIISQWGDMSVYTHTVETEYGLLWLKSSKINLWNYTDEVYFEWFVEKIYQWVPVISVSTIYGTDFKDEEDDEEFTGDTQSKYLPKIWLYLDDKFFEKYSLLNEWDGKSLKLKELDSNQIIEIQYFVCDKSSMSENCDKLAQSIGWTASQKFVDSYGNTYYKQSEPEIQSRFFTNGLYGYFIKDVKDSYINDLSKNLTLINKKYADSKLVGNISKLCKDDNNSLKKVTSSDVKLKNSKIMYILSWTDWEDVVVNCELEVDPTQRYGAQLSKFEAIGGDSKDDESESTENEEWDDSDFQKDDSAVALDPNVKQFPLKPEWGLVYTSNRWWYSMQFPSANIAYEASASSENMWNWLKCPYVINVIKYADKDNLKDAPTVQIYECSWDPSATSWAPWIVIYSKANKVFVAKVNDSAWFDFANNLVINELGE